MAALLLGGMDETVYAQSQPIFIANPKVLLIPINDNHESLVDIRQYSNIMYGPSPEIPNNTNYTKMRKTVYEKLCQAQALLPKGLRFCLYEGYRSLELQKMLFENRFEKIQGLHPDWTRDEIFEETTKLVSPVINKNGSQNIPPHLTGGAVDVYLLDEKNKVVDMGIHPKDWMQDKDGSVSATASKKISHEAQRYRKIMSQALTAVGFANYPTEYWHWSYGDRYWAHMTGQTAAIYGGVYS